LSGLELNSGPLVLRLEARSGEEVFHHVAIDVCQAKAAALGQEGQPLVVNAEQMENGCLEVVNVNSSGSELALVRL